MKLADRLKQIEQVEASRRLNSNLPIMVRIDGRCFSHFTRNLNKPFDSGFLQLMDATTNYLMRETNAKIAYTQSDEINLSFYNDKTNNPDSEYIFGGKVQKLTSVLASMASSYFSTYKKKYLGLCIHSNIPHFDCRVWNVPDIEHIALNYIWRYRDAIRNSVSMYARSFFSHTQLQGKNVNDIRSMLKDIDKSWENLDSRIKFGSMFLIRRELVKLGDDELNQIPELYRFQNEVVYRNKIISIPEELDSSLIFDTVNKVYGANYE